tara:strand:- start:1161 stop:1673 length:513 start_codon:yes stop_codon:yes gene_type:complete
MKKKNQLTIKKSHLATIAVLAIIAIIFSVNSINQANEDSLIVYKKALYDSISCQYSCPLLFQEFQNKSQYLPSRTCVQNCIADFEALGLDSTRYTDSDLLNDALVIDLEQAITDCRAKSFINSTETDSQAFFQCSVQELEEIKSDYPYLEDSTDEMDEVLEETQENTEEV